MPFFWRNNHRKESEPLSTTGTGPKDPSTSCRSAEISDSNHPAERNRDQEIQQHNDNTAAPVPSVSSYYNQDRGTCYNDGDDPDYFYYERGDAENYGENALLREGFSAMTQSFRVEIDSEVVNLAQQVRHFLKRNFPWVEIYRKEPTMLSQQHLPHLAIYLTILSAAILFLGGRSNKRGRGKRKQQHRALEWQNRRFYLKRSVSTGRVALDDNAKAPATVEKQESFSEQTSATTDDEEERFEQYYWEVIYHSNYRRLVLPPQCRHAGRNSNRPTATAAARNLQTTTFNLNDAAVLPEAEDDDNEDNPVGRIQYYEQQLWYLIRSILSFDYMRVAWMLWTWVQNFRRMHLKRRADAFDDDDGGGDDNLNICHREGHENSVDASPASPAAAATMVAIKGSNAAVGDLTDTLSMLHEEHEKISSTAGDDEIDLDWNSSRIQNPSSVDMTMDDQRNKWDDNCESELALTDFVSPRQEQTPVLERNGLHDSAPLRSHAPLIPPITSKQLLQYGMLQQQQHQPECSGVSSNDSDIDKVPVPSPTLPAATTYNTAGIDTAISSSSKRFITKVLPKRSWLRQRNSQTGGFNRIDLCGLDEAEEVAADLSEVDTDYDETTGDVHTVSTSPFRQDAFIKMSSSPNSSQTQDLPPQNNVPLSPSLAGSAISGSHGPMPLATASEISSLANIDQAPHQHVDHNSPTPASSGSENVFPVRRRPIHHTAASSKSSLRHFFDTANSRESLKKMSVEVTIPDKHGYILGDDFLPDGDRSSPLLVFVNSRSGPQQGHLLITQLRRLLNPIQIWDLSTDGSPDVILESFLVLSRLRILVCGGDGTVSWIIHVLEKMQLLPKHWPPIAILPLGTGNDLARIHGWGGGYNNSESLITILEQICESYSSLLDRWEVTIHDRRSKNSKHDKIKGFINYLGVGADAQAALQVHYLRESRPQWFFSRLVNKAMYGVFGAEDILRASSVHVRKEIQLVADGVEIPLPPDSQGIILLNIDSYAGGVPLWTHGVKNPHHPQGYLAASSPHSGPRRTRSLSDFEVTLDRVDSSENLLRDMMTAEEKFAHVTACDLPSSCQDGYLDVVSIRGAFHLGQIKVGLSNAQRLCQCREATITIRNKVAVQVDGEPWRQRAATLTIRRKKEPAVMLHRSADDWGVEMEMSKLLDWAEERNMIDSQVHSILMKEFSRRIESKTRQRRVRAQDNIMATLKKAISSGAMAGTNASMNNNINIMNNSSNNILWQGDGILF